MTVRRFFRWGFSSLSHQLILFFIVFSVPMFILFVLLNYSEGTLTWDWAVSIALYSLLGGIASGTVMWFTVTLPLIRRRRGD
jgi:hypothetical protein